MATLVVLCDGKETAYELKEGRYQIGRMPENVFVIDRAIVTATPGTTRDLLTERIDIGGIPFTVVDTAEYFPGSRRDGFLVVARVSS